MKKTTTTLLFIVLITAISASAAYGQTEDARAERARLNRTLQQAFSKFQRVEMKQTANGFPQLQIVTLNKDPLIIDGARYDGFKIKVIRKGQEFDKLKQSLVWGFVPPANLASWYIVPEHGAMNGFRNFQPLYKEEASKFRKAEPFSVSNVVIQTLDGRNLVDGQEYLIFFCFKSDEIARFSVALGFSALQSEDADNILRALGSEKEK